MNKEFQKLKVQYLLAQGEEKESCQRQMRENLKQRNGNVGIYTNLYTHQGESIDIETCEEQKLFEIDGDMSTRGI